MTVKQYKTAILRAEKLIERFEERVAHYTKALKEEPDNLIFEDNLKDFKKDLHMLTTNFRVLQQELSRLED